ncbi:MAG: nuclear transport factor 2 family protein [Ignavibacteria bacterium]|jgi:ketosteroid isomerase-like protein|nr:nuclear transport factor 2 family protein [Ignavibacteria bacterium]
MRFFVLSLFPLFIISSAAAQTNLQKGKDLLLKADMEFSRLSQEKGSNEAFLAFASDSAVLLRKNSYPVEGKSAIRSLLSRRPDTSFVLIWKPVFADIASSGELGYTYGTYEVRTPGGLKLTGEGTYVTIWKRDKNGRWKFVLDAGNEGLRAEKK